MPGGPHRQHLLGVAFMRKLLAAGESDHPLGVADIFRQRYPKVLWRPEQFVTEDGRLLSSGGVYASIDLSLYLVEKFCGHEIALQCAKALLLSMPRSRQSGYAVVPLSHPHSDAKIRQSEEYLQEHFAGGVSMTPWPPTAAGAAQFHPALQGRHRRCQRLYPVAAGVGGQECSSMAPRRSDGLLEDQL
jgi:hypothetical protein